MKINLKKEMFTDREYLLAVHNDMRAYAFKYSTGVEALRVQNNKGSFVILPFQGQQIWRAEFCGNDLWMRTTFDEPMPNKPYLETYGGFLLHCGVNSFGIPCDGYPQHGEIPNADYDSAYLECGSDEQGDFMTVGGSLLYKKSFVKSYCFSPRCKLYADGTVLNIGVEIENKREYPMEYMYLCHINFRPIDKAKLIYTAPCDSDSVTVYDTDVSGAEEPRRTRLVDYIDELKKNPRIMNDVGGDGQIYDPEICFALKYKGDENNRAYTMQYTDDGAFYVSHPTDVLPNAVRWISRTRHEDSMGMVLPSTAEHLGYTHAKESGQLKVIPPLGKVSFEIEAGYLEKDSADKMKEKIEKILDER